MEMIIAVGLASGVSGFCLALLAVWLIYGPRKKQVILLQPGTDPRQFHEEFKQDSKKAIEKYEPMLVSLRERTYRALFMVEDPDVAADLKDWLESPDPYMITSHRTKIYEFNDG